MSDKPDDYFAFDAAAKIIDPQAFSKWDDGDGFDRMQVINRMNTARDKARAIAALSATQHHQGGEQEPLAWAVLQYGEPLGNEVSFMKKDLKWAEGEDGFVVAPLYLAQQPLSVPIQPEFEYLTKETPRKGGLSHDDVWPEGDGWEVDTSKGQSGFDAGWDRFDCHEELYFRRRLRPAAPTVGGTE